MNLMKIEKEFSLEGVISLKINFHKLDNFSVDVFLVDIAMNTHRDIQAHKFYYSGKSIEFEDLGKANPSF